MPEHGELEARARAIAAELRRTHHHVAKDTIAYLTGGKEELLRAAQARRLDRRATTRAERKMFDHLRKLGLAAPELFMSDVDRRPYIELRRAVTEVLRG